MRYRPIASTIVLGAMLFVAHSAAKAGEADRSHIVCTRDNSEEVSVRNVLREPERFKGKCIRVFGLLGGRGIFADVAAYYAEASSLERNQEIAVYSDTDIPDLWTARSFVEAIGEATTCEAIWDESEANANKKTAEAKANGSGSEFIAFVAGNCHYHGGPALIVSRLDRHPDIAVRLTDARSRSRFGDLKRLRTDAPRYQEIRQAAEPWFESIRTHNEAALFSQMKYSQDYRDELLSPASSPLAKLVGSSKPHAFAYFDVMNGFYDDPQWRRTVACICIESDCERTWPLTEQDGYSNKLWPYFCIEWSRANGLNPM
jgi:hypothetical protein